MSNLHRDLDEFNLHNPKGFNPATPNTFATKSEQGSSYYEERMQLPKVINIVDGNLPAPSTADLDAFIIIDGGGGVLDLSWGPSSFNDWVRFNGGVPYRISPLAGYLAYNENGSQWKEFDGSNWVDFGGGGVVNTLYIADGSLAGPRTVTMGNNNLQFLSDGSGTFKVDSNGNSGSVNFYEYRGSLATSAKLIQTQKERGDWSIGTDLLAANAPNLNWNGSGTLSANVTQNGIKNFRGLYNGAETFSVRNDGNIRAGINAAGTSYLNFTSTLGLYLKGAINSAQPILRGADQNGNVVFRLNNSGSLAVGLSTPTAKLHVKGSGSTSGTTALLVQNSLSSNLLEVKDDGSTTIGGNTQIDGQTRISTASTTGKFHVKGSSGGDTLVINTDSSSTSVDAINVVQSDALTSVFKMNAQGVSYWQGAQAKLHVGASGSTAVGAAMVNIKGSANTSGGRNLYITKNNGDVLVNSYDNGTFALAQSGIDFNARFQVQGLGSTSGTSALLVQNSLSTNLLEVKDDGSTTIGGDTQIDGDFQSNASGIKLIEALTSDHTVRFSPNSVAVNIGQTVDTTTALTIRAATKQNALRVLNSSGSTNVFQISFAGGLTSDFAANSQFKMGAPSNLSAQFAIKASSSKTYTFFTEGSSGQTALVTNFNGDVMVGTAVTLGGSKFSVLGNSRFDGGSAFNGNLGLFGTTPIAQPTTAGGAAILGTGGGTGLTDLDTFDGYTLQQVVKALRDLGILA